MLWIMQFSGHLYFYRTYKVFKFCTKRLFARRSRNLYQMSRIHPTAFLRVAFCQFVKSVWEFWTKPVCYLSAAHLTSYNELLTPFTVQRSKCLTGSWLYNCTPTHIRPHTHTLSRSLHPLYPVLSMQLGSDRFYNNLWTLRSALCSDIALIYYSVFFKNTNFYYIDVDSPLTTHIQLQTYTSVVIRLNKTSRM